MRICCLCLSILWLAVAGHPLRAAEDAVSLTTLDGQLTIDGRLLEYDGEFFRIETPFGPVTLDGGNVTCTGSACPPPQAMVARSVLGGPPGLLRDLGLPLIRAFAERQGYLFQDEFRSDDLSIWRLIAPEGDRLVAEITVDATAADATLELSMAPPESATVPADVVALDALVAVVAPDNPTISMPVDSLRLMLEGRARSWPGPPRLTDSGDAAAPAVPIALHLPTSDTGALAGLSVLWGNAVTLSDRAMRHDDDGDLGDAVATDPAALGLSRMTGIGNAVPLILGGTCGRSILPSFSTVKTRDYPLTQPIYLLRLSARQPRVIRDFIAFARAHEAQGVVRAAGFVDQAITRIPFADQGDRLANAVLSAGEDPERLADMRRMIRALAAGQRLTLTFRFNDGSSALDPLSLSNVGRLADAIAEGRFDGHEMLFVGFTDGLGDHAGNIRLSQRRADAVLAAVRAQAGDAPLAMASEGFGETLPIACDDTNWGRQTNRRVEVWLR